MKNALENCQLTSVDSLVYVESRLLSKTFQANIALKRTFSGVDTLKYASKMDEEREWERKGREREKRGGKHYKQEIINALGRINPSTTEWEKKHHVFFVVVVDRMLDKKAVRRMWPESLFSRLRVPTLNRKWVNGKFRSNVPCVCQDMVSGKMQHCTVCTGTVYACSNNLKHKEFLYRKWWQFRMNGKKMNNKMKRIERSIYTHTAKNEMTSNREWDIYKHEMWKPIGKKTQLKNFGLNFLICI